MTNRYELLPGGYAVIYLAGGGRERATLIDAADLPRVAAVPGTWYAQKRAWTYYAAITIYTTRKDRRTVRLHRLLMEPPEDMEVDHINHDGLDNRCSVNLRLCTPEDNRDNMRAWGRGGDIIERWYEAGCAAIGELPF